MNARLPFLAALLGAVTFTAQAQRLNTAKLDSLLTSLAATNKLMGSLALSHEGAVVYSHAFGAARLNPTVPATEATRYRIGSISKVFTAVMIFQLIEEKKLTLDTKLATFFPQLPNAQAITIDQLLSHRSGLHSLTSDPAYEHYMTQPKTQAELLALIAATKPDFEPGAKYAYSNSGYIVLGYLVEKLTRQPYAQAVQQRIARKAGLRSTSYGGKIDPEQQQALSYQRTATGWQLSPETDMSIPGGAGALVATPADLNRFLTALFGGRLVSAGSLAAMRTIRDGYGRGLMEQSFGGTAPGYGHSGGIDEFASRAFYFPDQQLAIALCTNGGTFSLSEVVAAALKIYRNQPYRLPNLQSTSYVPAPADLDRYAGTYASPSLPLKISFKKDGTTLLSQATGQQPIPLEPVSQGVFKFDPAGIRAEFDAEKPTFTLKQGGREFVFTKE